MKEYLASLVETATDALQGRHQAREYLQVRILVGLQQAGAMIPLAFHGGTALRVLYQIPRYSEDLDFALEGPTERYNLRAYLKVIQANLTAENFTVELRINDHKVVHSAFIRFQGLLYELNISPHPEEILSIKLEVDTNPPAGSLLESTVIRRYEVLHLQHHDKTSLLAGKIHAVLQRPYPKGRDLFDLFWYLSSPDWPPPNLAMLNNALQQTQWTGRPLTSENWRRVVRERITGLDWESAVAEVRPLLMDPATVDLLTRENLIRLLS